MADVLEPATSARSRCRSCGGKIARGELRFGEHQPNPFGEGEATFWFHLACAACTRSDQLLPALSASTLDVPERARLAAVAEAGVAHPRATRLLRAERAPSGRARCRSCRGLIESGAWRLALGIFDQGRMDPIGFIHVECSLPYFETRDVFERIVLSTPGLDLESLDRISQLLASEPPARAEPALADSPGGSGPSLAKAGDETPELVPARRSRSR